MPRWCNVHKQDPRLILVRQLGISFLPNLAHIALHMVKVNHTQTIQPTAILLSPHAHFCSLLASKLIFEYLIRLVVRGNEYHKRQSFLFLVVGILVASFQRLSGLFYKSLSSGRPDERPELFYCNYFGW